MRVTLKLATSLDGRIATASGESKWITGESAREQVHKLRAMHRAVLVGVETAIADDPELTVRIAGYVGIQPIRVVLDSRQRLPLDRKLVTDARRLPTIVVTTKEPSEALTRAGVTVLKAPDVDGRVDISAALPALEKQLNSLLMRSKALTSERVAAEGLKPRPKPRELDLVDSGSSGLLIEGGGQVAASFLSAGLVDVIEWFRAPIVLGDEGRPGVGEFVLQHLADAPTFRRVGVRELGPDLWERYERA